MKDIDCYNYYMFAISTNPLIYKAGNVKVTLRIVVLFPANPANQQAQPRNQQELRNMFTLLGTIAI